MSNLLPTPPVGAPLSYRPISLFAVIGLTTSVLCAALVLVATVVALYQGAPFFYPLWLVLVPALTGFVVSLLARNQVRGSEGTQAGERLATAGIWLSVLFGLGYGVYVYVSGLAVTSQANTFVTELGPDSGFLPHLAKAAQSTAELNTAFLLTQPVTSRGNVRPEDEAAMRRAFDTGRDGGPGALAMFRKQFLVRLVATAPPGSVQFEPLGVQSWDYEERSYKVSRLYKITTPEVELEVSLPAASTEGETAGEPRRWYLELRHVARPTYKQVRLTELGKGLAVVRDNTRKFLTEWLADLNEGHALAIAALDATVWERLPVTDTQRGYLKARLQDLFTSATPNRLRTMSFLFMEETNLGNWKITEDKKVQIAHRFRLPFDAQGSEPLFGIEGDVVVETREPIDPTRLTVTQEVPCVLRSLTVTQAAPMLRKGP